jgi:hypothetical protein
MASPPVSAPRVSVIVRTQNEEGWIDHCLAMLFRQDHGDVEVIVVDNGSTDHTLEIVRRYPVAAVLSIGEYRPGLALNIGIRRSTGAFIACLSAHCVPQRTDWVSTLVGVLDDPSIAGVYGRQLPLSFSSDLDKRDLLTVFGRDRRIQTKDYFFHNANSMLRRELWEAFPFDEAVRNIEDRLWGKQVIDAGWRLAYEPEAAVYHHHGINQTANAARAAGVSNLLDRLEADIVADLPESLKPENCNIAAVAPVLGDPRELLGADLLGETIRQLRASRYVRSVYVLAEHPAAHAAALAAGALVIPRPASLMSRDRPLGEVLRYALGAIEERGDYPHALLYANYLSPFRPPGLFDELVTKLQYNGLDTAFPGYVDYNDHWVNAAAGEFRRVSESQRPGAERPVLYRSLYSLGCVTQAAVIRRGALIGDKVGVLPLSEHLYTLRCTDERPDAEAMAGEPSPVIGWTAQLFLREFRP